MITEDNKATVIVIVPNAVFRAFNNNTDYIVALSNACAGSIVCGHNDNAAGHAVYATYNAKYKTVQCEKRLNALMAAYEAKLAADPTPVEIVTGLVRDAIAAGGTLVLTPEQIKLAADAINDIEAATEPPA